MSAPNDIYVGTILLEVNRHKPGKVPTILVSEWIGRSAEAGFDGSNSGRITPLSHPRTKSPGSRRPTCPSRYSTLTPALRETLPTSESAPQI